VSGPGGRAARPNTPPGGGGGAAPPPPLDSSLPYVQGIAAAGTKVIWAVGGATDGAGKLRVSTSGGTPADLVTGENFPRGVYTDGTNVYWTAMGTNANSYQDGAIRRSGTTAPGSAATVGNATALHYAGIVYLQGTNLFFTEQGSNATTSSIDGKVSKILATAVGSTAPTPIQTGQNDPFGIAADATNVYWLTATAANKQAQTSGTLMNVAMAQVNPSHIVVDGVGIYWADSGTPDGGGGYSNGSIMYAPLNGGAAIAIATGQKGPIKLIADATSVYWTNIGTGPNFTDGSICKTVK